MHGVEGNLFVFQHRYLDITSLVLLCFEHITVIIRYLDTGSFRFWDFAMMLSWYGVYWNDKKFLVCILRMRKGHRSHGCYPVFSVGIVLFGMAHCHSVLVNLEAREDMWRDTSA
jgi:hypothetical protein